MYIYIGLFLICFAGLALEVTLVRLLSVTTWYHLAFFTISAAMLGMTAGATKVYLFPNLFEKEKLSKSISNSCIYFSLSIPITLLILCLIPVDVNFTSIMSLFALLITTLACALPFYFSGIIVSAVLTKQNLPIGKLYASDLTGAALGCLFVLGGMEFFDAPSLILLCGCFGSIAAVSFSWREPSGIFKKVGFILFIVFLLLGILNSFTLKGIRPLIVKGEKIEPSTTYLKERWNSFSRIAVYKPNFLPPTYYGASQIGPQDSIEQYRMNIDGEAATIVCKFDSLKDLEYLKYDVTSIGYTIAPQGPACIIGVGGGRDIHTACVYLHTPIVGVEINPIFVNLLKKDFKDFAGIANRPDINIINAEARSYLSQSTEKFSIIQMSLIDTWAATGAGAFSLSENALYTVEAWKIFLSRLEDNGIFSVSRWHSSKDIGETGRILSLAVATLLQIGVKNPSENLALISANTISTLIVSRMPITKEDINKLKERTAQLGFKAVYIPGQAASDTLLENIIFSQSPEQLTQSISGSTLNYTPPTDENPYFFNMLRLSNLRGVSKSKGVVQGNLQATLTLIALLVTLFFIASITIILPLLFKKHLAKVNVAHSPILWSGALYFSLIGCGFMLTEIALIQRLTVLLSHPIYALGILLFTLILSTGLGSMVSERIPLTKRPWMYLYPVVTACCLIGLSFLLNFLLATLITNSTIIKIIISIIVIFPMGVLMGLFFPTGMRLVNYVSSSDTAWYWALNGIFGVLCSAIAVLISIYVGISVNFYIAAACYIGVLIAQAGLIRKSAKVLIN